MTKAKLLLTSSGITNAAINKALVDSLGKPINQSSALFIPLAIYAYPQGIAHMWEIIKGWGDLGWKSLGVLELTALSSLPEVIWRPQLEATDALLLAAATSSISAIGWKNQELFEMLPQLLEQGKVYVGASAGSLMMTSGLNFDRDRLKETGVYYDDEFNEEMPSRAGSATTLGFVEFGVRPHLNADYFPQGKLGKCSNGRQKQVNRCMPWMISLL